MNVYVASSWRNQYHDEVVELLESLGHSVYNYRGPAGFKWSQIDPQWQTWDPAQYKNALYHPLAMKGYESDVGALKRCEACVLVLPSGRSASWELGYAMGAGKKGVVVMLESCEPDLMYSECTIVTSLTELKMEFTEVIS